MAGCTSTTTDAAEVETTIQQGVVTDEGDTAQGGVLTGTTDTATVTRVVDGDTIVATTEDGDELRVRILGIDTPESVHPDESVECYGPEASEWATSVLDGQTVTLRTDPTQAETDRYDRALRYVALENGTDYSVLAAREGMAEPYVFGGEPVSKADEIDAAAAEAEAEGRGLWGAC